VFAHEYLTLLHPCLFHSITGVPCPSCGATRSAVSLVHGDIFYALKMNPLFFLFYIILVIWGILSLVLFITRKKMKITLNMTEARLIRWGALAAIFINWGYLIIADRLGICNI
jgi:hypothetical protein